MAECGRNNRPLRIKGTKISILSWFKRKKPATSKIGCDHPKDDGEIKIIIADTVFRLGSKNFCPKCLDEYLTKHYILCDHCRKPILPGEPVALTGEHNGVSEYCHNTFECSLPGAYCGQLGENGKIKQAEFGLPDK